jgi:hypothetical protein
MNESSLVLVDNEIIDYNIGNPSSVEFNFLKIWKCCKHSSDLSNYIRESVKFIHVHPPGFLECSSIDINCLKGFCLAFGCTIFNFSIVTFISEDIFDLTHNIKTFNYDFKFGLGQLHPWPKLDKKFSLILKLMSYGNFNKEI